ncbi:MAG TPA: hypothetical protein VFQ35_22275 [Polyangiaceae bacterium]|nr:hypothetical protein [Polyangiaceae bacterium]
MKSDQEFYRRVVSDTLDSIVSPGARDTLLTEALSLAGEIAVPRRAREFRAFVRGPLSETLERALGQELGRSVAAELMRLSEAAPASSVPPPMAARHGARQRPEPAASVPHSEAEHGPEHSGARRPRSNQVSTVPPAAARAKVANAPTLPARPRREAPPNEESQRARPPISNDYPAGVARAFGMISSNPVAAPNRRLPVVFLATRDAELVRRFSSWLDPRASVVRVLRLADLLLHVEDAGERKMVIVLDGHSPPLRVEALAALCEELKLSVVLWGGTRDVTARLTDLFPRVSEWLVCGDQTPLADVVDRCAQMVG